MLASSHLLPSADARAVRFQGFGTRYVLPGERTGGAFAVVEHDLAPRTLGAPMHAHEREDEISHVLAGRLGVQIGDEVLEAVPGDTVFKPRGVPHAFWNAGEETVRFLELITPAGFEAYFTELEPLLGGPGAPDLEALGSVVARYGLSMDRASMPPLRAERGGPGPPA